MCIVKYDVQCRARLTNTFNFHKVSTEICTADRHSNIMEHPDLTMYKKYKSYTVLCNLLVICRILVQSIDEIEDANAIVNFGIMYYVTSNSIGRINCSMKIGKEVGN